MAFLKWMPGSEHAICRGYAEDAEGRLQERAGRRAVAHDACSLRLPEDRGRLRPPVCVLCDSADARKARFDAHGGLCAETSREDWLANGTFVSLILIAQDLTYYGLDIYKKRELASLVDRLSDVEGLDWIRLHYAFPTGFPMDVLDVMAAKPNVCNYLDMPLQHASDEMLKSMRRGITQEKMDRLIGDIRNRVPEIALRTTLICGFPGETEAHHEDMLKWTERMRFDRVGCFTYSHEENTHAYSMQDDVSEEVKKKRVDEIMTQQAGISFELNQKFVGTQQRVLIDRLEDGQWIGRTEWDSPDVDNEVRITAADDVHLRIGDFVMAQIDSATEFDLHGRLA